MRTDGRADRQTERRDEANGPFSQFCERAWNYMHNIVMLWGE